jgi:hypothetical protein
MLFGLTGEADNHIEADGPIGDAAVNPFDHPTKKLPIIQAVHALEDLIIA